MSGRSASAARRRTLLAAALAVTVSRGAAAAADAPVLRIGLQKSSTLAWYLRSRRTLEEALIPLGVGVQWHEFASGLPMLEALNVGALDLAADVADAVPPFALAAGASLSYYASEAPSPHAQAIVVRRDSPIVELAQLKGVRVGFARGAGAHYLLLRALAQRGLHMRDIEPVYLTPADGRAAFESGAIGAWVIWDPFLAAVQRQSSARILIDGQGLASYRRLYLASTAFARKHGDVLALVYHRLQLAGAWIRHNPEEAAQWNAPLVGLDAATMAMANDRRSYRVQEIDAETLSEQQRIADVFTAEQVLPRPVDISLAPVWHPVG
jgi:sulfonate transport system substrate-binding protein